MTFITLVVITVLCIALPITRLYGAIGAGLLLYLYLYLTIGVLLVSAGAFYYYRKHYRSKSNVQLHH